MGDLSCDSGHPISNGIDVPTDSTTTIIPNRNTSSECEKVIHIIITINYLR